MAGLLSLMAACADMENEASFEPAAPNVPPIDRFGSARAEYDGFGTYTYTVEGAPYLVVADEGLSCRPSWSMGPLLKGGVVGGHAPFFPAESAAGLVLPLPVPTRAGELIGLPIGDGYSYWSGGVIEVVDWTADRLLVALSDGEVCESEPDGNGTCTPASGTIDVDRGDIPGPLDEEVDAGWRGESLQMIDPATNEPLCDHVTSGPGTTDTSSGTTNR